LNFASQPLSTSSHTGLGLGELRQAIFRELQTAAASTGVVASTAARCRESLAQAGESLSRARQAANTGIGEELVVAEVRGALEELGRVAGVVYTDDLLDRIFSRFCIGK
jgi:tRNA modification GTPase